MALSCWEPHGENWEARWPTDAHSPLEGPWGLLLTVPQQVELVATKLPLSNLSELPPTVPGAQHGGTWCNHLSLGRKLGNVTTTVTLLDMEGHSPLARHQAKRLS